LIVYCVENAVNGKRYVGKTTASLLHRWSTHCAAARRGSKLIFHRALRKHGVENFFPSILAFCSSEDELSEQERKSIIDLSSHVSTGLGYNVTWGGDGVGSGKQHPCFGTHVSEETKAKMSVSHKGKNNPMFGKKGALCHNFGLIRSEETIEKMRSACKLNLKFTFLGGKHTEETKAICRNAALNQPSPSLEARQKMGQASKTAWGTLEYRHKMEGRKGFFGRTHTEEARKKISLAGIGRVQSEEHKMKKCLKLKGKKRSEEFRQKIRDSWIIRRQNAL
jgi:group I intron endonuclease